MLEHRIRFVIPSESLRLRIPDEFAVQAHSNRSELTERI